MSDKKIKVLLVPSDIQGVGHFRSIWPAQSMEKHFSDKVSVEVNPTVNVDNIEYLKQFDIIHFHRALGGYEKTGEVCQKLHDAGVLVLMDIDDYWEPPITHPLYEIVKNDKLSEKITGNFQHVHYVTTTTDIFASHIQKYNSNTHVIPNALDMTHKMWKSEARENPTDKTRIAWIGGSSHLHDLKLLESSMNKLNSSKEFENKYQIITCGFDTRGSITQIGPDGSKQTRKLQPHETVWIQFEKIFTSNYALIKDPEYLKFINKIQRKDYDGEFEKNFVRRWTLPLTQYGKHYDFCDVCLAPIEITEKYRDDKGTLVNRTHMFNEVKCITGDSLISTDKGIINIKKIVDDKINCLAEVNGKKNKVINHFEYKNVDTVKITTYNGYEIEGTPHHKLFIKNKWIKLKDLKTDDIIELTSPVFLQKKYQQMSFPMLLTKNMTEEKIKNCDESMIPKITVNEKWGRFLGYMLGDGNYGGNSLVRISCDKRHTDVVDDVVSLMKSIGLNPSLYEKKPDKRCNNSLIKESFGVDVVSTCITFLKIAKKYNLCGSHGKTFRIPELILQSPKSVIKEFLKGLFEADGTVENSGLSLCSKDLKLIQQVQYILLGFNITSYISHSYNKHYRKYYYKLNLRRDASDIFYKEINFISKAKIEKLAKITKKPHSNRFNPQSFEDKIVKIQYSKNTVYDIEISDVHLYNANGIINHNSELKIIEAGMKKKALIAQDFSIYKQLLKNDENALIVSDNKKGWYNAIARILREDGLKERLAENLHEFVKDKYELKNVTEKRVEFYHKIIEENKKSKIKRPIDKKIVLEGVFQKVPNASHPGHIYSDPTILMKEAIKQGSKLPVPIKKTSSFKEQIKELRKK